MRYATVAGASMWAVFGRRLVFRLVVAAAVIAAMVAIAGASIAWADVVSVGPAG